MNTDALYQDLRTPLDDFLHWERITPDAVFLRQPYGREWRTWTYAEAGTIARRMVGALRALGLRKGDHIGILSKNCHHWILADLAIMMGGHVSVPFYASTPKASLADLLRRSDVKALFIGKLEQWGDKSEVIPEGVTCIRFPHYPGNAQVDIGHDWDMLLAAHEPVQDIHKPGLDELWTILFTSGTTGSPKGVMHRYRTPALIIRGEKLTNFIGIFKVPHQKYFSFLPLNHVGERIGVEVSCLASGGTISFGESIDTFIYNLQDTQPTMLFAVPRIWTKFHQGVLARMPEKRLNLLLSLPVIGGIVRNKIRTGLGMRDVRTVATGAAITPKHIKRFFRKLGIHLIESYGMTEACGSISNGVDPDTPENSVGRVVPFCEVRIDPSNGEILMKTPHAIMGYYKEPEMTAQVLPDGWIHSGDKGHMDDKGYLYLTGRINDAFKTAKGQFIVPNPIEERLSTCPHIEQVCLVGMTCPQPIALVNLNADALKAERGIMLIELNEHLNKVNTGCANHERVSTIVITQEVWSEDNQLLTPTLKVRRERIDARYADHYLRWHEEPSTVIWEQP
ncbi:MAG: AMP-binding protein [Flavobacteriales bacterium]|nr:AMP-binding protein [Flavobacteriales bacterium]